MRARGATSSKRVSKKALPRRVYGRVLPFSKVKFLSPEPLLAQHGNL